MKISTLPRIQQLRAKLKKKNAEALLISNSLNTYYLTGFQGLSPHEREAFTFISQDRCILIIPEMYREQASVLLEHSPGIEYIVDSERDGLLALSLAQYQGTGPFLIEENDISAGEYEYIKAVIQGPVLFSDTVVETLREIKDEEEQNVVRKAAALTDGVFKKSIDFLQSQNGDSVTESQLAHTMREWAIDLGGDGFGFDPIISIGSGSSQPHYKTGKNLLKNGPLLMDFGVTFRGYTGDLTRTIYIGNAPDSFKKMYKIVLECNTYCIDMCKPGVPAYELHQAAVSFFQNHGVEKHFIHGLGHGVGLDIHEEPYFRSHRKTELVPGMVITIEPGLYFPGDYGIRIEDYVLITETGCEVLSTSSKELLEI